VFESSLSGRQEFRDRFNPEDPDYVMHVARRVVNLFENYRKLIDLKDEALRSKIIEEARARKPGTYGELYVIIRGILDKRIQSEDKKSDKG
jgi:hypothetical protein